MDSCASVSFVLIRRSQSSARASTDRRPTGVLEREERFDGERKIKSEEVSVGRTGMDLAGAGGLSDGGVDRLRESLADGISWCDWL